MNYLNTANLVLKRQVSKITTCLFSCLLALSAHSNQASLTYSSGNIRLGGTTSASECTASMVFNITPGSTVDSIRVYYDITASGWGYMSDARSQIRCTEGSNEAGYTAGAGTVGTQSYNRSISPLFTGVTGTGTLTFTLAVYQNYTNQSCGGANTDWLVDNNTWTIDVYYTPPTAPFQFDSCTTFSANSDDIPYCTTDQEIIGLRVYASGNTGTFNLTEIQFSMNGTTIISDATGIDIFYTGTSSTYSASGLFSSESPAGGTITANGSQQLQEGINYFWIAYDMTTAYTGGNIMDAECTQITVDGSNYSPTISNPGSGRTTESCQNYPGHSSSNLKLWLMANQVTSSDGSLISSWRDKSGNSNDASNASAARQPRIRDNAGYNLNYNAVMDFVNDPGTPTNNDRLDLPTPTRDDQNIFIVFATTQTSNTYWFYDHPNLYGGDINSSSVAGEADFMIGLGTWGGSNDKLFFGGGGNGDWRHENTTGPGVSTGLPILFQMDRTDNAASDMDLNWRVNGTGAGTLNQTTTDCANGLPDPRISIGAHLTNDNTSYDGSIAEIITYEGSMSASERNKIESYLAIKYGVTLDQTSPQDYVLSDGTVVWDASVVGNTYDNDITGISRDDLSALNQKQSKSSNLGSLFAISLGSIVATNSTNSNSFSTDGETMIWSNDAASKVTWSTTELPTGVYGRLNREWYVEENNGDVGQVYVQVNDADLPTTGGDIVHLLYDTDGDFNSGASILPMTLSGGVWSTPMNFNDGVYFSFGINTEANALPTTLLSFDAFPENNEVKLEWQTATELNCDYFVIDRSIDGAYWTQILQQPGTGTTYQLIEYADIDPSPENGINYYRLSLFDIDGKSMSFPIRVVEFNNVELDIQLSSNPVKDQLTLTFDEASKSSVTIYDVRGRIKALPFQQLENQVIFDVQTLSIGVYFVKVELLGNTEVLRIVKE